MRTAIRRAHQQAVGAGSVSGLGVHDRDSKDVLGGTAGLGVPGLASAERQPLLDGPQSVRVEGRSRI